MENNLFEQELQRLLYEEIQAKIKAYNTNLDRCNLYTFKRIKLNDVEDNKSTTSSAITINLAEKRSVFDLLKEGSKVYDEKQKHRKSLKRKQMDDLSRQEEDLEEEKKKDDNKDKDDADDDIADEVPEENLISSRKTYSKEFKQQVMNYYIKFNFSMTISKYKVPEGTLKRWITAFTNHGEESFVDKRQCNGGKPLDDIDVELVSYIKQLRSQHLPVTPLMITQRSLKLMKRDDFTASSKWLRNFLKRNSFSIRKKTHVVQKLKDDYHFEVERYFKELKSITNLSDPLFLNFDETSVPFDPSSSTTIDEKGSKEVSVITHNKGKLTCTMGACISSDGKKELPMAIFKYYHETRKCPKKYEDWILSTKDCFTKFNESGFNNVKTMAEYLNVLLPKVKKENSDRQLVLVLDSATCHFGKEITDVLELYSTKVVYIPGGCTSFLQPLDVSFNKPLKCMIRKFYQEWLVSTCEAIESGKEKKNGQKSKLMTNGGAIKAPEEHVVHKWFMKAYNEISEQLVKNSFVVCGITFGLSSIANLNKTLLENFDHIIENVETRIKKNEELNPYMDSFEIRAIDEVQGDEIIINGQDGDLPQEFEEIMQAN